MQKKIAIIIFLCFANKIFSQPVESILARSEYGIAVGAVTYYGDLNPYYNFNSLKPSIQLFYLKNNFLIKNIGLKLGVDYNYLHYADKYNDNNHIDLIARNLSFTNETFGISAQLNFNFLNYSPLSNYNWVTPYLNVGIGALYSNPFDFDAQNNKVFLQPLITERINNFDVNVKYNSIVLTLPISLGFKVSVSKLLNLFAECTYTLTNTDYLDDVSKQYAGQAAFNNDKIANYFQDRSTQQQFGVKDKSRGTAGSGNDGFISFKLGMSFNKFISCCPPVKKMFSY